MLEGNVFILSVCVTVLWPIAFDGLTLKLLVWWCIVSKSTLTAKVMGQGQGQFGKIDFFDF